jgi:hypothetical protein
MQKCTIALHGCDDSTYFDMEITNGEFEFLKRVSNLSRNKSTYGCMPTLNVDIAKEEEEEDDMW